MADFTCFFDRALELYEKRELPQALKYSFKAVTKAPLRWAAYVLMLKSLARLVLPSYCVLALKAAKRSVINILDYAHYLLLKKELAAIQPLQCGGAQKILFIVRDMGIGGVSRVNLDIIQGMAGGPFEFHVAAASPVNNAWFSQFKACCRTVIVPKKELSSIRIWGKYFCQIARKMNIQTVAVSNSYVGYQVLPYLKSEIPSIKAVDILHMEGMWGTTDFSAWIIPYLDKRVLISNSLKDHMLKQYKKFGAADKYSGRLEVIYNGIDTLNYTSARYRKGKFKAENGIPQDVKLISFIGRFSQQKLPQLFVDIANGVLKQMPAQGLKFVMAGDGELMGDVKKDIKMYGLEKYFSLTGALQADKVAELLADTYLLLISSLNEGMPLVMFEAMLMGVPVISAPVGAIAEVIEDGANGRLVCQRENASTYVKAVDDFISGRLDYDEISNKARRTISERYSIKKMIHGYTEIFQGLHSPVIVKGRRPAA
ncbi:MAG: glycosyltransferase family 4 protein [Actinomycetota bacterium]|nr:glycosyltransferase family 4 protein [Actinomycetota bacterium]